MPQEQKKTTTEEEFLNYLKKRQKKFKGLLRADSLSSIVSGDCMDDRKNIVRIQYLPKSSSVFYVTKTGKKFLARNIGIKMWEIWQIIG
jgi:hypothetical protein